MARLLTVAAPDSVEINSQVDAAGSTPKAPVDPQELLRPFFDLRPSRLVRGVPAEEYHAWKAVNASLLKKATPKEQLFSIMEPNIPTGAMMQGTITHSAVLEPEMFATEKWKDHYQIFTKTKTLDSKAALEALAADPRPLITPEMLETAHRSRDAVWAHKEAARLLLEPGACEVSGEAWDQEMCCMRKARFDRLPDNRECGIIDLKSTASRLLAHPFRSEVYKYGYHIQGASYLDTLQMIEGGKVRPSFWIIAVTNIAPFMCRVFELEQTLPEVSFIVKGRDLYQERFASFVLAYAENAFDGYENEGGFVLTT